jgi:hypothetical protein
MKLLVFILVFCGGTPCWGATVNADLAREYFTLAKLAKEQENLPKAKIFIEQAIRFNSDDLEIQQFLLMISIEQNNFEQALLCSQFILEKRPEIPSAWSNVGYCLKSLGNAAQAIPYYERAITLRPDTDNVRQMRAECLLKIGRLAEGWPDAELRFRPKREDVQHFISYMQSNGDLRNKKILLQHDFGMGDVLQFIRYAQLLKSQGAYIIVIAHKPLVQLLKLCPYLDEVHPEDSTQPAHDLSTVIMSLPYIFNTTLETIPQRSPYLYASPTLIKKWKNNLSSDKNFKIGLCWNANNYNTKLLTDLSSVRCIPLKEICQLYEIPGLSFYSLQQTTGTDQIKTLPSNFILHTFDDDFDKTNGRFMDTAAVMKNLDLVITIDTSIAHLAGGLGVPTWIMVPYVADWRWLEERTDSPWYPTMKIFRQAKNGDWKSVIDQIKKELEKRVLKEKR